MGTYVKIASGALCLLLLVASPGFAWQQTPKLLKIEQEQKGKAYGLIPGELVIELKDSTTGKVVSYGREKVFLPLGTYNKLYDKDGKPIEGSPSLRPEEINNIQKALKGSISLYYVMGKQKGINVDLSEYHQLYPKEVAFFTEHTDSKAQAHFKTKSQASYPEADYSFPLKFSPQGFPVTMVYKEDVLSVYDFDKEAYQQVGNGYLLSRDSTKLFPVDEKYSQKGAAVDPKQEEVVLGEDLTLRWDGDKWRDKDSIPDRSKSAALWGLLVVAVLLLAFIAFLLLRGRPGVFKKSTPAPENQNRQQTGGKHKTQAGSGASFDESRLWSELSAIKGLIESKKTDNQAPQLERQERRIKELEEALKRQESDNLYHVSKARELGAYLLAFTEADRSSAKTHLQALNMLSKECKGITDLLRKYSHKAPGANYHLLALLHNKHGLAQYHSTCAQWHLRLTQIGQQGTLADKALCQELGNTAPEARFAALLRRLYGSVYRPLLSRICMLMEEASHLSQYSGVEDDLSREVSRWPETSRQLRDRLRGLAGLEVLYQPLFVHFEGGSAAYQTRSQSPGYPVHQEVDALPKRTVIEIISYGVSWQDEKDTTELIIKM